jgi:non-specific serine/threonine protein kinase
MSTGIRSFFSNLRKKRIIEILAAFIAGGWLIIEVVHFILIGHYHFPEKTLDITIVTLLCALACTLIWRWFSGREKPRKFKLELVIIPLLVLITVLLDINLLLHLKKPESEPFYAAKWKNSIAVLPFVDMSPQKDQEYFCDGMAEELINRLGNIKELKVPARTSTFMFKGKAEDIREIGRKLDVRTVLEGSIRKEDSQLRITVQLVSASDSFHIWSETFDKELTKIFAIQDEIALTIVDKLKLTLLGDEKARLVKRPIDNVSAYECYLKAIHEILRFREDSLDRAIQYLQNGIDMIGENALLYTGMANAYFQYVNIGAKQEDYIIKAEEYAKKALALEPDFPKANALLGWIYSSYRRSHREGIRYLKKALSVNPNEPTTLALQALMYQNLGRPAQAIPFMKRFKQVDPMNPRNDMMQGYLYLSEGQYLPSLEPVKEFYQSDPESPMGQFVYVLSLAYNSQFDKAFSIIDQSAKATPNNAVTKMGLLLKYGLLKNKESAYQEMTPDFQKTCQRDFEWSYYVADAFALLDEKKEALDWLENAVDKGFINYPRLAEKDPWLANIRGEPRFKKLMERVKYEWERFEE